MTFMALSMTKSLAIETGASRPQTAKAKKHTVYALQAIRQNKWEVGRSTIASLRDPLASKLYYWIEFTKKDKVDVYIHLAQFIRQNPEWPGISGMMKKAETQMPTSLSNMDVIAWFDDFTPQTATGLDRYIGALLESGQTIKAKDKLENWWASGTLSRDDQRHLYRKYKQHLSMDAHKRRFDTMLYKKNYSNARGIAQVLGTGYSELAEARIALAENKGGVNALINKVPQSLQGDAGLLYERLHWRRTHDNDVGAMQILHNMPPLSKVQNPEDWWLERHIIIRRLLEKRHWRSAYLLASKHQQQKGLPFAQAEWLSGWLALRFLNEPVKAYQHFDTLYRGVSSPISRARAAYWAGRASEGFDDKSISQTWYRIAAQMKTVFYGQTASEKLGIAGSLPHMAPPKLTNYDHDRYEAKELMQAAIIFKEAGLNDEAARFMRAFAEHEKSAKAYYYAATKAADIGLTQEAVRISKKATNNGLFLTAQSYPLITNWLSNVDLEWALVHGIIRQESMFDISAQSHVGASGLMQLMPGTAKEVSRRIGEKYSKTRLKTDPAYNIRLGSRYLADLVERYDGFYPMAIAAYNAGPSRVTQWIEMFGDPRKGEIDMLDWIELIPIYETRNYVQRVMEATYIYRLSLKDLQPPSRVPLHVAMNNY